MPALWPVGFPTIPLWEGYSESIRPNTVATPMDTGPAKVRPRTTKYIHDIVAPYKATTAQRTLWITFYWVTLKGGADVFDWPHPTLHVTVQARIQRPTEPIDLGAKLAPDAWRIVVPIECYPPVPT